jgi:hypothetical protein
MLLLAACSDDDADDGDPDGGAGADAPTGEEAETEDDTGAVAPAEDGTEPDGAPDLSQELATTSRYDERADLVVHEVRQTGDEVTVWATITNVSDDDVTNNSLVDPTLSYIDQTERRDVSGVHLVDWNNGRVYYPMMTDGDTCLCSSVPELEPGESTSLYAVYNGVGPLEDASLIAPGYLPADGLSAQ